MRLALDLSCLVPQPLTGVGYYTINLFEAYRRSYPQTEMRAVAFSAQAEPQVFQELRRSIGPIRSLRLPSRVHHALWGKLEWPPIEWFTGAADIAHGAFHVLPAARKAKRCITLYDLSNLRRAKINSDENIQLHYRLLKHAAERGDAIIAISESSRQDAIELIGADPDRTHVVYGGVVLDEFSAPLDAERQRVVQARFGLENGGYFIYLGTLEPRKNVPRIIEAYARVRARARECPKLVLAGGKGWMYDEIFARIQEMNLADAVIHTGYLKREDAVVLLRGARACLYPSLYEGFGLPVLEAMAARVPVLTSNVSSLPEVIGDAGIQVHPESVDEIEAGIARLLNNPDEARQFAEAGFQRAAQFTWDHSAQSLQAVYEKMLA